MTELGNGKGKGGLTVVYASDGSTDFIEGKDLPFSPEPAGATAMVLQLPRRATSAPAAGNYSPWSSTSGSTPKRSRSRARSATSGLSRKSKVVPSRLMLDTIPTPTCTF